MTRTLIASILLALFLPATSFAGPIERACLKSDRNGATRSMCRCIQQAADMTLRGGDQRQAAKFFRNPDQAQKVKMSKRSNDDAFWDRYQAFGAQAEAYCTR